MNENEQLAIDKVVEQFRPKNGTLMVMMTAGECEGLVRMVATLAFRYGWEEGMSDAEYSDKSKH